MRARRSLTSARLLSWLHQALASVQRLPRWVWLSALISAVGLAVGQWALCAAVQAKFAQRIDGSVRVGSVGLRWRGLAIGELDLSDKRNLLRLRIRHLSLQTHRWSDLLRGKANLSNLSIDGLSLRVDLSQPNRLFESLERGLPATASSRGEQGPSPNAERLLRARLTDLTLEVQDVQGGLLHTAIESLALEERRGLLRVSAVDLGRARRSRVKLRDIRFGLLQADRGRWRLSSLDGGLLEVVVGNAGKNTLQHRLASLAKHWRRLRRSQAASTHGRRAGNATNVEKPEGPGRLLALTTPGASLRFRRLSVEGWLGQRQERWSGSDFRVVREARGRFRLRAKMASQQQGHLRVDMGFSPEKRSADGAMEVRELPLVFLRPWLGAYGMANALRAGSMSADIALRADQHGNFAFEGLVSVDGLSLAHERLGPDAVHLPYFDASLRGRWHRSNRHLHLAAGRFTVGDVLAEARGDLVLRADARQLRARVELPPTPCAAVLAALPAELLGPLRGFAVEGSLRGLLRVDVDVQKLADTQLDIDLSDRCRVTQFPEDYAPGALAQPFVHRVFEDGLEPIELYTGPGGQDWVPLETISPFAVHAVLAHEDASFFRHRGFAPWSMREALARNLAAGRFVMGGSTISMQLARNLYLHRDKHLTRKLREVLLTWWLERMASKRELLALYLNIIEYGQGVYGIGNAAQHYFGRPAQELTAAQGAFLATVLPSPKRYEAQRRRGKLSGSTQGRVARLLRHMHARGRIDDAALEAGLAELEDGLSLAFRGLAPPLGELPLGSAAPLDGSFLEDDSGDGPGFVNGLLTGLPGREPAAGVGQSLRRGTLSPLAP